jgi:adenylate cyclase
MTSWTNSLRTPVTKQRRDALAILFADLDGFTQLCREKDIGPIFALVQGFQKRVTRSVLECGGRLNNYLGDGAMATFATSSCYSPASQALRCANVLSARIRKWNRRRELVGRSPVSISIGAQYGDVMIGAVGTKQHFELTVLGDAVNVASRLTGLAQQLGAAIATGEDLVIQALRERGGNVPELRHFVRVGPQALRGRETPIIVWTRPRSLSATGQSIGLSGVAADGVPAAGRPALTVAINGRTEPSRALP